jgi:hypothetical protein
MIATPAAAIFPKAENGNRQDSCGGELVMGLV